MSNIDLFLARYPIPVSGTSDPRPYVIFDIFTDSFIANPDLLSILKEPAARTAVEYNTLYCAWSAGYGDALAVLLRVEPRQ